MGVSRVKQTCKAPEEKAAKRLRKPVSGTYRVRQARGKWTPRADDVEGTKDLMEGVAATPFGETKRQGRLVKL
jgi:hypothetical protein